MRGFPSHPSLLISEGLWWSSTWSNVLLQEGILDLPLNFCFFLFVCLIYSLGLQRCVVPNPRSCPCQKIALPLTHTLCPVCSYLVCFQINHYLVFNLTIPLLHFIPSVFLSQLQLHVLLSVLCGIY